jgi:hypothetical protein
MCKQLNIITTRKVSADDYNNARIYYDIMKLKSELSLCSLYVSETMQISDRIENNNIQLNKLEFKFKNALYTKNVLRDINRWFLHSMTILLNNNKKYNITKFQHLFSKIIKDIIRFNMLNKQLEQDIIIEKYKPSRIQYIIDNYGIDALDEY